MFGIRRALKKSGKPLILQRSHSGEWRKIQKDLVTIFRSWSPSGTRRVSGNCKRNGSNGRNWHSRVSGCRGHRNWSNGRNPGCCILGHRDHFCAHRSRRNSYSFLGHGDFRVHICSGFRDESVGVGWNGTVDRYITGNQSPSNFVVASIGRTISGGTRICILNRRSRHVNG